MTLQGRQFVWDGLLFDETKTTAEYRLHHPQRRETVMTFDRPWEGNGCGYFHIVRDDIKGVFRMYYLSCNMYHADGSLYGLDDVRVCCLESADGGRGRARTSACASSAGTGTTTS